MENFTIKIKQAQEVEVEISIPKYFTVNKYNYYKFISDSAVIAVTSYTDKVENMAALELWPSVRVEHIRYISYYLKADNLEEITEEEFLSQLNAVKKLIYSL